MGRVWHNSTSMSRWFFFLVAISIGVGLGLLIGWFFFPVQYVDTSPDTLRVDYKSDYVLMVAEAYSVESDLQAALRRLALLGSQPPAEIVREAILFAERQGYPDFDVALMQSLASALQGGNPLLETPSP